MQYCSTLVPYTHELGFHVKCGISGCSRTYSSYHSFRKHIQRRHAQEENVKNNVNEDLLVDDTVADTELF